MDKEALEQALRDTRRRTLYRYRDAIFKKQDRITNREKDLKLELFVIHSNLHPIGEEEMDEEELKNHLFKVNAGKLEKLAEEIRHKLAQLQAEYSYLIPAASKIILDGERKALLEDKTFEWW